MAWRWAYRSMTSVALWCLVASYHFTAGTLPRSALTAAGAAFRTVLKVCCLT